MNFKKKILKAVKKIPKGKVLTYKMMPNYQEVQDVAGSWEYFG